MRNTGMLASSDVPDIVHGGLVLENGGDMAVCAEADEKMRLSWPGSGLEEAS